MSQLVASLLFLVLLVLAVFGLLHGLLASTRSGEPSPVTATLQLGMEREHLKLFVLVHGYLGDSKGCQQQWGRIARALQPHGDVLLLRYSAGRFSTVDPQRVADGIREAIREVRGPSQKVVLVGHSIGALLARRAFVDEQEERPTNSWEQSLDRIVLLAGMNRGWDVSGQKPMDMHWYRRAAFRWGSWFGRLTRSGSLIIGMETGAPFVQNLRIHWMELPHRPRVVQLLGDIDDVVGEEDSKDLRAAVGRDFVWIRVRGTGHSSILDLADKAKTGAPDLTLGKYREHKLLLAATGDWDDVVRANEELHYEVDEDVTHVVFVLHGIRDLGEWSAGFDHELQQEFRSRHPEGGQLRVVSVRYGFFGMGQFLLDAGRERYVRWFVDQYTETRARYPNARRFDFVGHSNGTYLLAEALVQYRALRMDHVVFAGSVAPTRFQWDVRQVRSVRNLVGSSDWVVALFPRFFETWCLRWMGNDIGSAGFNGFEWRGVNSSANGSRRFANVTIKGGHSAFLQHTREIARYLVSDGKVDLRGDDISRRWLHPLRWLSNWGVGLVWFGLILIVFLLGRQVTAASGNPSWPVYLLYLLAVTLVLRWV